MLSVFINLPSDVATSTLGTAGGLVSDFSPIWTMILGVLLFGILIAFLVGVFTRHH